MGTDNFAAIGTRPTGVDGGDFVLSAQHSCERFRQVLARPDWYCADSEDCGDRFDG